MVDHHLPVVASIQELLSELSVRPRSQGRLAASTERPSPWSVEPETATLGSALAQSSYSSVSAAIDDTAKIPTTATGPKPASPVQQAQSSVITKRRLLTPDLIPYMKKLAILERAPRSAGNLLKLAERVVHALKHLQDPGTRANDFKLNPVRYGATFDKDLGLCYETFFTREACRFGTLCKWRHDPLTEEEKAWIVELGARHALAWMEQCYPTPETPAPKDWYATQVVD